MFVFAYEGWILLLDAICRERNADRHLQECDSHGRILWTLKSARASSSYCHLQGGGCPAREFQRHARTANDGLSCIVIDRLDTVKANMKPQFIKGALIAASLVFSSISAHAEWFITDLGTLGGSSSSAFAINNNGQVVGEMGVDNTSGTTAFLYENGVVTNLGYLPGGENIIGGIYSTAAAINASGQIAGSSINQSAFSYSGGQMSALGTLGGLSSQAYGINDAGQIVGTSTQSGYSHNRAFLYSNGAMTNLGSLGGDYSVARGINNSGVVTGTSYLSDGHEHAFVYSNGTMTDIGTLGGPNSEAVAINNAGQIVGNAETGSGIQAFIYSNGQMTNLGAPLRAEISRAYGINNLGQVVGVASTPTTFDAFLYSAGTFLTLNSLAAVNNAGWYGLHPYAINDHGDIVGSGGINGETHAFILSPNRLFAAPGGISAAPEIDGSNAMLGLALLGGILSFMRPRKSAMG